MKQLINLGALLASLIVCKASQALPDDLTKPLNIQANKAFGDRKIGQVTYQGDVVVKQGSIEIQAQSVEATPDSKTRKFSKLVATSSPVKFSQQIDWNGSMLISRGDRMNYMVTDKKLEIFGNGFLNRMDNKIMADYILYHIDTGTFKAQKKGSRRVSMTLQPADNTNDKEK